ncbi:MAG: SpoIID/LytB domain-containing protein [Vicinamibacteria bacterium]|nr:SpoIID/LytB domain-containing protein [Vicinamibacteria bacterium]
MSPWVRLESGARRKARSARWSLVRRAIHGRRSATWRQSAVALFAATVSLAASCRSAAPPVVPDAPRPAAATTPAPASPVVPAPAGSWEQALTPDAIRVGVLTAAKRATLGADSGLDVWVARTPGDWGRPFRLARLSAIPTSAATSAGYRVQVASLIDKAAAERMAQQVAASTHREAVIQWSEPTRTWQVRIGPFATREEAVLFTGTLSREGFGGSFVAPEGAAGGAVGRLRVLETGEEVHGVRVRAAAADEFVALGAEPYRGGFELRATPEGTLSAINVLPLEEYLRGVVPNELSPSAFPELEALKAQAVAARTYAVRNRGQFEALGYDICATPTCQVYRGQGTEHPLTDQAIAETRGLVATSGGRPINALYTSTCGGHTEQGAAVFKGGDPAPYLAGVACVPEQGAWTTLRSTAAPLRFGGDGGDRARDLALLTALGVLGSGRSGTGGLDGAATEDEIRTWTSRLVAALKRKGCDSAAAAPIHKRRSAFLHVASSLCWQERGARLLAPRDAEYLLQVEDAAGFASDAERKAAAVLLGYGIVAPDADNRLRPEATISRVEAASLLARAALEAGPPGLVVGQFRSSEPGDGRLLLQVGEETRSLAVAPDARLFRAYEGRALPASALLITTGDRVRVVQDGGRVVYVDVEQTKLGAAADRTSRLYRWEVRLTPADVEKAVARYGTPGAVRELKVKQIGISGRVLELDVVGAESTLTLTGLQVRWGLGLRENLFVIDREYGDDGQVARFVFTGKGWGHGVGLCQVGAFGLARAGAKFDAILRHYYRGIAVETAR